jgi:ADP-L-glycero-D-manno-heptose 6-epimerase
MIIVTGAGGFIGSVMVGYLNSLGITDVIAIDDMTNPTQYKNLIGKQFTLASLSEVEMVMRMPPDLIKGVIHMGAISDTLANNWPDFYKLNVLSTRQWANACAELNIPFVFASSAAIYGNGAGPLNQYAFSKYVSEMEISDRAACLRFFNVYGPNEYHKGRMASTIMHWFNQSKDGPIKVFENSDRYFRDFVYVEDICKACYWMIQNYRPGVFDLGTGESCSFESIARTITDDIEYIPMPDDLKNQYQTDTKADMRLLTTIGFDATIMRNAKQGIKDYLEYLKSNKYY